jgi:hypothetical protein
MPEPALSLVKSEGRDSLEHAVTRREGQNERI